MAAVKVSTYNGLRTVIKTDRHTWYADETEAAGGLDTAADPEQQLLGAVGSCMVITVQLYARRKEWPLEKVEVELDIEKLNAADYPSYQGDAQYV
ncbi:MAG: OsmC family protein, partial [Anaerolineae bacterium]|nr:OsmC family protein [Anaerolineae bacterium]